MQDEYPARGALDAVEAPGPEALVSSEARREIESTLSAFRRWLFDAEAWRTLTAPSGEDPPDTGPVDLHSVLREWIALKQELKIEARGSKAARRRLDDAVEAFHGGVDHVAGEAKGLLDSIVGERDRLRDEMRTLREKEGQSWAEVLLDARDMLARAADASRRADQRRGWRRWLFKDRALERLGEGYGLALNQLDRALEGRGIRPITCENQPVDPYRMRVIDVVRRDDMTPGVVVEVIRRGYVWGSRVIRYAEVRAVAAHGPEAAGEAPVETEPADTTCKE